MAASNHGQGEFIVIIWRRNDTPLGWSYIQGLGLGWTLRNPQERKCSPASSGLGTWKLDSSGRSCKYMLGQPMPTAHQSFADVRHEAARGVSSPKSCVG